MRAWFPVFELVGALTARGGDVGGNVAALAQALGGLVWPLSRTQRQPSKHGLMVSVGDERLELHMDEQTARAIAGT